MAAATIARERTEPVEDPGRADDLPPDNELFDDVDPALAETGPSTAGGPVVADEEMAGVR